MNSVKYYLSEKFFIKLLEFPSLYNIKTDELYSLDKNALKILKKIEAGNFSNNLSRKINKEFFDFCINEGIITEKPVRRIKTKIKQSPLPSLKYLELQVTKRCNLKCKHCFVGKSEPIDLPFEKIKTILKEFEALQGLRVLITGGEPLLHPEFERINEFIKKLALRKILFTNGTLLNEKWLKKLNVEEIQISIDGMKKGHEILRGKGTFNKALNAIKKAVDYGFDVSVATVIHRKNIEEFNELEKLIKKLNVKEWIVDALTISGNLKLNTHLWVTPDKAGNIMKRYGFSKENHPRADGYGCGAHLLAVMPDGKAAFCSFYEDSPIGEIDEGLGKLWAMKNQILLKDLECSKINCPFLSECRGGCRFRAITLSGNSSSPDLFRCYQFGRLP
uniref:Radical SAM protein n=1 Tax=Thermodesulfovibrio aggregans TaxID=86166 RepID=A0A7C4AJ04_9BACT